MKQIEFNTGIIIFSINVVFVLNRLLKFENLLPDCNYMVTQTDYKTRKSPAPVSWDVDDTVEFNRLSYACPANLHTCIHPNIHYIDRQEALLLITNSQNNVKALGTKKNPRHQ